MIEQKRYTAQDYRQMVANLENNLHHGMERVVIASSKLIEMLRQSADAEEENAQLKASKDRWMQYQETAAGERNACIDELRKKDAEIASLKARLEAVVKECEIQMKKYDCGECNFTDEPPWTFERCEIKGCPTRLHAMEFLSILRVARGDAGKEEQ